MAGPVGKLITRLTAGMRFPTLFLIVGGLFLVNLVVPDLIPLYDEILMATQPRQQWRPAICGP